MQQAQPAEQNDLQESGSSGIAQSEGSVQGMQQNEPAHNMIINQVILPEISMPVEHQLMFTP